MRKEEVLILRTQIMKAAQQKETGKNMVIESIMDFLFLFPLFCWKFTACLSDAISAVVGSGWQDGTGTL